MDKLIHKIEKLPDLLKNQIKAGEVITRPKDVVKEIMENALDAGATKLILQIKEAGLVAISLTDNGRGIPKEQLTLALTAHATSKLKNLEGLEAIETMGFRGEALASIVSVSRVTLSSKTNDQPNGWALMASQDQFDEQGMKPSAIIGGTKIEIRDLFFNAKARREFLSSVSAETAKIDEVVRKIALSRFDVEIQYQKDKKSLNIPSATSFNDLDRLKAILGEGFVSHALWFSEKKEGVSVYGFVTNPQYQRAKGDKQYLFINKRPIKDLALLSSIRRAYQDVMYQKNQPGFVIYIDIDPKKVDVNIHPTKEQVRLKEIRAIGSLLYHSIGKTLASLRPAIVPSTSQPYVAREENIPLAPLPNIPMRSYSPQEETQVLLKPEVSEKEPVFQERPLGQALAQLQGVYILSQAKDGLILVDMHAAHERIVYEGLKVAYKKEGIAKQVLLVPLNCELTDSQMSCAQQNLPILSQLGVDITPSDKNNMLIRALPKVVSSNEASLVLQTLLNMLIENQSGSPVEDLVHELLSLIACHSAIRANRQLSLIEMDQLLRDIEKVAHGSQCNHGRPTWIHFSMKKLDALFHRGQ